jgi:Protein of unknown function (DUF3499)
VLAFDYASRRAILQDPGTGELSPHLYSICHPCAERLTPPLGWTLEDRRSEPVLFLDGPGQKPPVATTVGSAAPSAPDDHSKQLLFGSSS